jgi:hypothetical protein
MANDDSALDPQDTARIRELLRRPVEKTRMWPALGAAFFAAVSALAFATAMILAPPVISEHVVESTR